MYKPIIVCMVLLGILFSAHAQFLRVSDDSRYLTDGQGEAFVWIGDTAWELFHRLNREEATAYLRNRVEKGFTVIQAVVLAENDGLRTPNAYGDVPFENLDPEQPNEAYFEHVDFIVQKAEELGLIMGMLPTWGDKLYSDHPAAGPIVFTETNAEVYGEFLGERYKDAPVVWILGGDRNVANQNVFDIWTAMARGIRRGDGGRHLMSFHPRGDHTSAYWFHDQDWLDFNMVQSGHARRFNPVYEFAELHLFRQPRKPFLEAEPAYEDIPIEFWRYCDWSNPQRVPDGVLDENGLIQDSSYFEKGYFTDYDVRVHAYWNVFAGACGYTYGNNAIWQMYRPGQAIAIPCLTDWRTAMDRPGAADMRHLRDLLESRPFDQLLPDQSVIYGRNPRDKHHVRAAVARDGSFLFVYLPTGKPVDIVMSNIKDDRAVAWWFNPGNGETESLGEMQTDQVHTFTPPVEKKETDWVLVVDGKSAGYAAPGVW